MITSFIKGKKDDQRELANEGEIKNLNKNISLLKGNIEKLHNNRLTDSTRDAEFQLRLEEKFKIKRDSTTNQPITMVFDTKINNAGTVNIGR